MNVFAKVIAIAVTGALLASCTPQQQNAAGGAILGGAVGAIASGGDPAVTLGAAALGGAMGSATAAPAYPQPQYTPYQRCRYSGYSHYYCKHNYYRF